MPPSWIAFVLGLLCIPACCGAAPAASRRTGQVVRLEGDLDYMAQVDAVRQKLMEARRDGVGLICLEIGARAWRLDVALALGELLAASEPPAAAFVPEGAGAGAFVAAARANAGAFAYSNGKWELRESDIARDAAPEPARLKKEEKNWTGKAAGEGGGLALASLREAILEPAKGFWLLAEPGSVRTGLGTREGAKVLAAVGSDRLVMSEAELIQIGLVRGPALDARAVLSELGVTETLRTEAAGSSLESQREKVVAMVEKAQAALADAERGIREANTQTGGQWKPERESVALAREQLSAIAAALKEVPEILRTPAPGQPESVRRPAAHEQRWNHLQAQLAGRADRIEKAINNRR
ncbi:MAG: hypothetical protein U0573_04655 [Phycisphaerales bacterium]|nr:hypothetical protein [Planctomycetota bacterium]